MTRLNGKTVLVTGATDGIGRALVNRLCDAGASVIVHGRNEEKIGDVLKSLDCDGAPQAYQSDFASLAEVARLADAVAESNDRLDVLVNNAGLLTDHRQLSHDGFELTFAVNYLAPWLLTNLLLPLLIKSAPARIVNVSSTAMGGGQINLDDLQADRHFDGWQAYANSKLANIYFSAMLAQQLAGSGVTSNALCPGLIDTNFFHTNKVFAGGAYERMRPGMRPPVEGADIPFYLATAPEMEGVSGSFYLRGPRYYAGNGYRALDPGLDDAMARIFWDVTAELLAPWLR